MTITFRALAFLMFACALCAVPRAQCYLDKATASDPGEQADFGRSVSMFGDKLAVGAHRDPEAGTSAGAAYLFERVGGEWEQVAKVVGSTTGIGDDFGRSVSMWNGTLLVGSPGNNVPYLNGGTAYVFERVGTNWVETATLHPADGAVHPPFLTGEAVSLHGDTALIGARMDDEAGINVGAVYVHERSAGSWSQTAKLLPTSAVDVGEFGASVDVYGDLAVVGAPQMGPSGANTGGTFVFRRQSGGWIQEQVLVGSDSVNYERFGDSVAVCGDTVVVGSFLANAMYVFERTGSTWSETAKLTAEDIEGGDHFGVSLSISGDVVLAGANGNSAAYIFERIGTSWLQTAKISSSVGNTFGRAVGLDRSRVPVVPPLAIDLVVGAPYDLEAGFHAGAAYFLDYEGQGCPSLSAVPSTFWNSSGGTQHLTIDGGPASAGKIYLVAGSLSGSMPGTDIAGLTIPLNMDGYTLFSLIRANQPPYVNTFGVLDPSGRATAELHFPPDIAQPMFLHHAFFVLDLPTFSLELVSNAEPLTSFPF